MAATFTKTSAFLLLLAALVHHTNAKKTCHAISKTVTNGWCQSNCNHVPPNCPAKLCKCTGPKPPTPPSPSPKPPTPPSPSPKPPTPPAPSPKPPTPPSPSPKPPTPPSPSPLPNATVIGYWDQTWAPGTAPKGATMGMAFSGWNNPVQALTSSEKVKSALVGAKWIDAGGGNLNGRWNASWITQWQSIIEAGNLSTWDGIVLDVEECFESGLAKPFGALLRAAKAAGLRTMVTTSHSAPYKCDDAKALMQSFFASDDCDYISPQLYASGNEKNVSFEPTSGAGVAWSDWVGAKPLFVPSLAQNALANGGYEATQKYFAPLGINCTGYIMWFSG